MLCIIENLTAKCDKISKDSKAYKTKLTEFTKTLIDSEDERAKIVHQSFLFQKENTQLLEKVKDLESKLHKIGQTEHTIHLNKPKEFTYYNALWGIGYDNPQYLKTIMSQVPILYSFECLGLDKEYPEYKINWTGSAEIEKQEDTKRKNTIKLQLPFAYEELNFSCKKNKTNYLSNNYFLTEPEAKAKAKEEDTEFKLYVPPLMLENNIVQLEKSLEWERAIFEKEKQELLSKLEASNPKQTELVSEEEKKYYKIEIARLTSKLAVMATEILQDKVAKSRSACPSTHSINGQCT